MRSLSLIFVILLFAFGCQNDPETLVREEYNEKEMTQAIDRARQDTDDFLKVLEAKDADSFSVKAPITDGNGTEHFWITDIRFENGVFVGLIGNHPGIVKNVALGDEWKVKKEEISDWMFVRGDRIYGGHTIDPLLGSWDKEKSDALRKKLVR